MKLPENVVHYPERYDVTISLSKEQYETLIKNASDEGSRGDIEYYLKIMAGLI